MGRRGAVKTWGKADRLRRVWGSVRRAARPRASCPTGDGPGCESAGVGRWPPWEGPGPGRVGVRGPLDRTRPGRDATATGAAGSHPPGLFPPAGSAARAAGAGGARGTVSWSPQALPLAATDAVMIGGRETGL